MKLLESILHKATRPLRRKVRKRLVDVYNRRLKKYIRLLDYIDSAVTVIDYEMDIRKSLQDRAAVLSDELKGVTKLKSKGVDAEFSDWGLEWETIYQRVHPVDESRKKEIMDELRLMADISKKSRKVVDELLDEGRNNAVVCKSLARRLYILRNRIHRIDAGSLTA